MTSRRRTSYRANKRGVLKGARREIGSALKYARSRGGYGPWPAKVATVLKRLPAGYYRYARGKLVGFKSGTTLSGAMTSARIAASRSGEKHMLIEVRDRTATLVREFNGHGKTVFRIEEAV